MQGNNRVYCVIDMCFIFNHKFFIYLIIVPIDGKKMANNRQTPNMIAWKIDTLMNLEITYNHIRLHMINHKINAKRQ